MKKIRKHSRTGTERSSSIDQLLEKIGGSGGGSRSRLKIKKKQEIDDSPRDPRITEKFLEDHGYTQATTSSRKPFTYEQLTDGGKYRIYTGTSSRTGREGVSQTTMNNPSVKELKDWMGY